MMNLTNSQKIQAAFRQDGYAFLPGFMSSKEMDVMTENMEHFIKEEVPKLPPEHAFFEDKSNPDTLKQLFNLHTYDPYFEQILLDSKFEQLAEMVLEEKVNPKNLEYFNKPPKIGKPTPPHQDNYYFMLNPPAAITMWLALEDVDAENGCVRYVKGSHLQGMRPHGKSQIFGFSQAITDYGTQEDLAHEIAFPAKRGDLLIHHSMTIHRADGNTSETRSRKAFGFVYWGESAQEDLTTKEAYRSQISNEIKANAISKS
jgi:phytanoyl-CoA hydroxylase